MKHLMLVTFVFLGSITCLYAYPIIPRPLRLLVKESQYIVVGYVSAVRDSLKKTDVVENGAVTTSYGFGPQTATLKVLENLKGSITADSVQVESWINIICPEPARYQKETLVIAFLDKDDRGRYSAHALSYGVKTLKQEEIEIYKKRILEIQHILNINDQEQQFTETIEWLVKCAEIEATQWEGLAELNPRRGNISLYPNGKKQDLSNLLNADQVSRLKPLVINNAHIDWGLADLLYSTYPNEIESSLIKQLKTIDNVGYLLTAEYIPRLKSVHLLPEVKQLIKSYNLLSFEEKIEKSDQWTRTFIAIYEMNKK